MNMGELEKIRNSEKAYITPAQAAAVLECDPQYIRLQAREDPEKLGFPVVCIGNRTKILRLPFLRFVIGGGWDDSNGS